MCNYVVGNYVQEYRLYRVIKMEEEIILIKSFGVNAIYIYEKKKQLRCIFS